MSRRAPRGLLPLLALQAGVGALIVVGSWGLAGAQGAAAAALGGGLSWLAQAGFAWRLFATATADATTLLRGLYRGEGLKLVVIGLGLIAIFRSWPDVPPGPLFTAFIAVQGVHWLAPLLLTTR